MLGPAPYKRHFPAPLSGQFPAERRETSALPWSVLPWQLLAVLQRPPAPAPPPQRLPQWTALPPRGSAPSWLGRPRPRVQATAGLPWAAPGPSVVPLSYRYVLLAPTPVWSAPRVRSPLLDADWQHRTCDLTRRFGACSVPWGPRQVLGTQYHRDGLSSALRAAASQPGWWCAESAVQTC